jgi:hypothetical protein
VGSAQRSLRIASVDDDRDVSFRRALRDRPDVDARLAQRAEELRRDTGLPRHAVADHREDAAAGRHVDGLNLSMVTFGKECVLHCRERAARKLTRDGEAD